MGLRDFLAARWAPAPVAAAEAKSAAGTLVFTGAVPDVEGERPYRALARAGFMHNPVVYRSVRLIAENAAAIPLLLYEGPREVETHPMLALLRRPNAGQDGAGLVEALCGHLLLSGDGFLECISVDGVPRALFVLRPDRMRVIEGRDGWPEAYEYRVGGSVRRIAAEGGETGGGSGEGPGARRDGPGGLLHIRLFHPLADTQGFAPLSAARAALDLHNAAARWNKALLDNSARPSGALVYQPGEAGNLSPDQFDRLKLELESGYTGAARAGRPMLLEGGLDWKAMGLSPKDMDFIEAKNQAARDIALAFGVPPMLLGIPGDNTYANYAEANRAFYRLTVLPLIARLTGAIGDFLAGHFATPGLRLGFDADRIDGLGVEREALWARVGAADFLSEDEKREAVGYGPRG
ncbi:portal protein [Aureimonas sp. SA4125]|uniref:phage portal protein n=1 Tax=Aureimonas sp. SA4125 TaxID=2826993 RepID=UPI001CC6BC9A|nr:phage portal protein [Aureimonas sp. SA4125]BDA83683.1 portal protein [Aureimonas sp. SA4125]